MTNFPKVNIEILDIPFRLGENQTMVLETNWFRVRPRWNECHIAKLPNLSEIHWPYPLVSKLPTARKRLNGNKDKHPSGFDPAMSIGQLRLYRKLFQVFANTMFDNGFGDRFMMCAGTLLGSFRHHDFIPWDDEIDVMVDDTIRGEVRRLLSKLSPEYRLTVTGQRDKFYARPLNLSMDDEDVELGRPIPGHSWNWPFIDISYYGLSRTHVKELALSYMHFDSWPIDVVFPLYFRPFGSAWYPAPRNPLKFLQISFGHGPDCKSSSFSHSLEKYRSSESIHCRELGFRYPFVEHRPCTRGMIVYGGGKTRLIEERLVVRSEVADSVTIHSLCLAGDETNAFSSPYSLEFTEDVDF